MVVGRFPDANRRGLITGEETRALSGHSVITVPRTITGPATHIHQINGFTSIRNPTPPLARFSLGTIYKSSTGVERMAALVEAMLKLG